MSEISLNALPDESEPANAAFEVVGLIEDTNENWRALMEEYGIDEDEVDINIARRVLRESILRSTSHIDFDDMLLMPVVAGASFYKYDVVFVDEAQDVSGIQMEMIERMTRGHCNCSVSDKTIEMVGHSRGCPKGRVGRVIAVGDSSQSIYHFRGAGSDSMPEIEQRFNCKRLPLSISYRCPRAVVRKAQTWVKTIEFAPEAPEGLVVEYPEHSISCPMKEAYEEMHARTNEGVRTGTQVQSSGGGEGSPQDTQCQSASTAVVGVEGVADEERLTRCYANRDSSALVECPCGGSPGTKAGVVYRASDFTTPVKCTCNNKFLLRDFLPTDAILCRLTRPLVETAFKLIRARIACKVLGRDIGSGLVSLVRKSKLDESRSITDYKQWLEKYAANERKKLTAKEEWSKLGLFEDRIATLMCFVEDLEAEETIRQLINSIESLFKDDGQGQSITLATVHKSKGLEWDRVFLLDANSLMPRPWAKRPSDAQQEINLMYVAATRAKQALFYIESKKLG